MYTTTYHKSEVIEIPYTGTLKRYYDNGQTESIYNFKDGKWIGYTYKYDEENGQRIIYYSDGLIQSTGSSSFGELIQ